MSIRCPGCSFVGIGTLQDYSLQFDGYSTRWKGAVANVIPKSNSKVIGGLYLITPKQLHQLDAYEEYGSKYDRQIVIVETTNKELIEAIVYLRAPLTVGTPSDDYISTIKAGYLDCGIDIINKH